MSGSQSTSAGVKLVAVWAAITGLALVVLGLTRTFLYLPVGSGSLLASYGLWAGKRWGLVLGWGVLATAAIQDLANGSPVQLLVVLVVAGYLYARRGEFA